MAWGSTLRENAETLKGSKGKDVQNDQKEAASNQPILPVLKAWGFLKAWSQSHQRAGTNISGSAMTPTQQVPTLCSLASLLLEETGPVGSGSSRVGAVKNHPYQ